MMKTGLPQRIKEIRSHLHLGQKDMAAQLGIGLNTYIRYEKGDTTPGLDTAAHLLAMVSWIDPGWLITGTGDMLKDADRLTALEQRVTELER